MCTRGDATIVDNLDITTKLNRLAFSSTDSQQCFEVEAPNHYSWKLFIAFVSLNIDFVFFARLRFAMFLGLRIFFYYIFKSCNEFVYP